MDCSAFCTASSFNIKQLFDSLRVRYKATLYRDVVHIEAPCEGKTPIEVFYFPYGATICWGVSAEKGGKFIEEVLEFEHQPLKKIETDDFTYVYGKQCNLIEDEITLPDKSLLTKLAVSHALAQSVKLNAFEVTISNTFKQTKVIPQDLAEKGKISLSRKQIRKKMGELFIERSSINLHVDILDVPDFFWDHSEVEPYYKTIANELDIKTRGMVLNQRLDVEKELFEMLANELNHQHSNRLEWIIIWLINIEVILTILQISNLL